MDGTRMAPLGADGNDAQGGTMSKLLYITASPRKERSYSLKVADAFIAAYRNHNPQDIVDHLDLFSEPLPPFDGATLDAKYAILSGGEHTPAQAAAWQPVVAMVARFKAADKYLFALPMWNFSVPYKLKHYFDLIVQPGLTFRYDPATGYQGLVPASPVAAVFARGGAYTEGTGYEKLDFQSTYLDLILGFIGLTDIRKIFVEPTLMAPPEEMLQLQQDAIQQAERMAAEF
jgi:FMN-dependent NADH-azoreductase